MSTNKAAWLTAAKARPFKIDESAMPVPEPHEVVIKNRAVAINPIDTFVQAMGMIVETYPAVLGFDIAGEVTAVGSNVKNVQVGDRVTALTDGLDEKKTTNCGFQLYTATNANVVSKLPDNISFAQAAVIPLGLTTAAAALFEKDSMALPHPHPTATPTSNGKVLLVWGGSSSVGACAIQLAKGAGFTVATTASSRNHEFCKNLGADYVFDHTKDTVVEDIVSTLQGKQFQGAFCVIMQADAIIKSAQINLKLGGQKLLGTVYAPGMPDPEGLPSDIKTGRVWGGSPAKNEVGDAVWQKWLPAALANGSMKCKPDPLVVGQGLEAIQAGCDRLATPLSAQKVVVELL